MKQRRLAAVANFHRERRLSAKTARFLAASQRYLAARGVDFLVEFVLDRPDEETEAWIARGAASIPGARLHRLDVGDLGAARAHGVRSARADVVCFVDGDDLFSMNWFECAAEALSGAPRREILHTQFLVAFGEEQFIRETVESRDPAFDPLSLAVDWYWNGNLALQTWLFEEVPIEPYDHAAGFGSEDWHWACNTLAAGIHRVIIPQTCYYYRIKPAKLALGRVGEVIHKRARLYETRPLPPPPSSASGKRPPMSALNPRFFAQAREIETFELGVSWLRALEAGALSVQRFRPHTPPLVGRIVRGVFESGFKEGSLVIFADEDRLPRGLAAARGLASAISGGSGEPPRGRLYVVEGDEARSGPCEDGYAIAVRELVEAGLNLPRRQRLIARLFIQAAALSVVNLLSPRRRSLALSFNRATRGSVARWTNVVTEYGSDGLSQAWEEISAFAAAGLEAETLVVFEKTAVEAATVRGWATTYDPKLEADWVSGSLGRRRAAPAAFATDLSSERRFVRLGLAGGDPALSDEEIDRLGEDTGEAGLRFIALGGAQAGWSLRQPRLAEGHLPAAGLFIPAVTVIGQGDEPNFTLVHPVDRLRRRLARGELPAELLMAGVIGLDAESLRQSLRGGARDLGAVLRGVLAQASGAERSLLAVVSQDAVSYIGKSELAALDVAGLARRCAPGLSASR